MTIIILGVVFFVFLLMREVWCWYWKINKTVALLEQQNELLKKIAATGSRMEEMTIETRSAQLMKDAATSAKIRPSNF